MDAPVFSTLDPRLERAAAELAELRRFPGTPREFWPRFLTACAQTALADIAVLMLGRKDQTPRWMKIGEWTAGAGNSRQRGNFLAFAEQGAERAIGQGSFVEQDDETAGAYTVGVRLRMLKAEDEVALLLQCVDFTESAARESLARLALAADTPALYQGNLASRKAATDVEAFATVFDLMVPINAERRFLASALALANSVAARFRCERVALGWIEGGYVKLKAMSRTEKFSRQMGAAQALEAAMEECADQDEEIIFPVPEGASAVARDHEKFVAAEGVGNFWTLPLRDGDKVIAVVSCERQSAPPTSVEMQQLRLLCDTATPRLADLKKHDRWFGARMLATSRERLAKLAGPEHTWAKVLTALAVLLLIGLFVVRLPYRVEGNFILRSDAVSYVTAPFDGFIKEVSVRPGDALKRGAPILALDRAELLLEQAAALAEMGRYEREGEKARAVKQLAEMRIAESLYKQSKARLDAVNYRLEAAVMRSPFDGVVVEGDLRERIAAPVKSGEALFKIARLEGLFVEADVDERDIEQILQSSRAEFSFVSQPKRTFSAKVTAIEPAAMTKKEGNVFLVRLEPEGTPENWWRPGMTGLCKISVANRSAWWILTHRTVDWLRLKLWW